MLTPEQRKEKLKLATFSDEVLEILTAPGEVGSDDAVRYAKNLKNIARNGPIPPEERKGLQGVEEEIEKHLTKTTTAALMASESLGGYEVLRDSNFEAGAHPTDGFQIVSKLSSLGSGGIKWIPPAQVKFQKNIASRPSRLGHATPPRDDAHVKKNEKSKKWEVKRPHGIYKTKKGHYQVYLRTRKVNGVRSRIELGTYVTLGEAGRKLNEYLRVENPKNENPLNWPIFPDEYYDSPEAASFYK